MLFLQNTSQPINTAVTFGVVVPTTLLTLLPVSPPTFLFYLLSVSAISLVCPFWFTKLQRLKKYTLKWNLVWWEESYNRMFNNLSQPNCICVDISITVTSSGSSPSIYAMHTPDVLSCRNIWLWLGNMNPNNLITCTCFVSYWLVMYSSFSCWASMCLNQHYFLHVI